MKEVAYFMDFIEQKFSDKEKLRKIVVLHSYFSPMDTWEDIFKQVKKWNMLVSFFDSFVVWDRDFLNLGKESARELENIHLLWASLCLVDKIEFKKSKIDKNIPKIRIIFEGEQEWKK